MSVKYQDAPMCKWPSSSSSQTALAENHTTIPSSAPATLGLSQSAPIDSTFVSSFWQRQAGFLRRVDYLFFLSSISKNSYAHLHHAQFNPAQALSNDDPRICDLGGMASFDLRISPKLELQHR